jgi:hypothetical protein
MIDWTNCKTERRDSWGNLVDYAREFGVEVAELAPTLEGGQTICVLRRSVPGVQAYYPIPDGCTHDRKLGFGRLCEICTRLRIPRPDVWPIDF